MLLEEFLMGIRMVVNSTFFTFNWHTQAIHISQADIKMTSNWSRIRHWPKWPKFDFILISCFFHLFLLNLVCGCIIYINSSKKSNICKYKYVMLCVWHEIDIINDDNVDEQYVFDIFDKIFKNLIICCN